MRPYQWARLDLADGTVPLMRRRTPEKDREKIDCYPGGNRPPAVFPRSCGRRRPVEESHSDAKQLACTDANQARTWTSLHRHLALPMSTMLTFSPAEADELHTATWNPDQHRPHRTDQPVPTDLPLLPPSRCERRDRLAPLITHETPDRKAHQAHWPE